MASSQDKPEVYKPEHPADAKTIKKDQEEIREAAKHAAQEAAAEELGDDNTSREEAEKELHEAVRKVQQEKKKGK